MCFPSFSIKGLRCTQVASAQFSRVCQEMPALATVGPTDAYYELP